jgi:putative membrane protein
MIGRSKGHCAMMKRLSMLSLLVLIVLAAPFQAMAQQQAPATGPQPPYYYGPGPWHVWGGGGFQFWWICPLMLLFMLLIFGAVFFLVRRPGHEGPHHWGPPWQMMHGAPPTHSALQILNERFARGEIQKEEYEEKKGTILSGGRR